MFTIARSMCILLALLISLAFAGCGDSHKDHDHKDHNHKDHDHKDHDHKDHSHKDHNHKDEGKAGHGAGHGGKVIALGEGASGPYKLKVTRDEGELKAGGEGAFDVWVDPAADAPRVAGVRFWVGTQDARGSIKAKAEIADPKDPNRWHTHAELPDPIPAGAKLWVEIEDEKGATTSVSFDLKG